MNNDILCPKCNKLMMKECGSLECIKCSIFFYKLERCYHIYVGTDNSGYYGFQNHIAEATSIKKCLKLIKLQAFI